MYVYVRSVEADKFASRGFACFLVVLTDECCDVVSDRSVQLFVQSIPSTLNRLQTYFMCSGQFSLLPNFDWK